MNAGNPIKLVIADVDGTLLTREKILTDRAIAAARSLRRAGVRLALTSGRPPRGLAMLVEPLEIDVPLAAFNGGMFVRPDLSPLETLVIGGVVVSPVAQAMAEEGLDVWLYRGNDWLVRRVDAPHVAREQWTVRFPPSIVPHFEGFFDQVVKMVGVSDDHQRISRALDRIHEACPEVSAALSQPYYLDVTHPDANKGRVVERLSETLGIPLEQVAAIGDMPNDLPMFRRVALSIAMGQSADEVRRSATAVTTSSQDEGFARAIEKYVLGANLGLTEPVAPTD